MSPASHSRNIRGRTLAVLATVAVVSGGALGYRQVTTGGGSPPAAFSGTFDCYGSTPNCTGLSPKTCTSTIAPSSLQTSLNSATGGEVFCLNSSSSANISLTSKTYGSVVTVQPASGVAAVLGDVHLNNVDNLQVSGVGAADLSSTSLTITGSAEFDVSSGCSANDTIDHVIFGGTTNGQFDHQAGTWTTHGCSNMHIVFDHDRFDNGGNESDVCESCRFYVDGNSTRGLGTNVTVSNSHFNGPCSDGVYVDGGSGLVVGPGNEFENFSQTCATFHTDTMSGFTSADQMVIGNYFHNNSTAGGTVLSDREPGLIMKNNVVLAAAFYSPLVKGPDENAYTHNYFAQDVDWDEISNESTWGNNNLLRNNIIGDNCLSIGSNPGSYTADHNLGSGTGCDTSGTPVFVSSPASGYYHYVLDSSSPGYHAGSDGKSLGICDTCG